jgi:hypothetical protein
VTRPLRRSSRPTFSRFGKYPADMFRVCRWCMHHCWPNAEVVWCCACLLRMLDDVRRGLSGETTGGDASHLTFSSPNNLTIINTRNQHLLVSLEFTVMTLLCSFLVSCVCSSSNNSMALSKANGTREPWSNDASPTESSFSRVPVSISRVLG